MHSRRLRWVINRRQLSPPERRLLPSASFSTGTAPPAMMAGPPAAPAGAPGAADIACPECRDAIMVGKSQHASYDPGMISFRENEQNDCSLSARHRSQTERQW
jgi:hypothetical protein